MSTPFPDSLPKAGERLQIYRVWDSAILARRIESRALWVIVEWWNRTHPLLTTTKRNKSTPAKRCAMYHPRHLQVLAGRTGSENSFSP